MQTRQGGTHIDAHLRSHTPQVLFLLRSVWSASRPMDASRGSTCLYTRTVSHKVSSVSCHFPQDLPPLHYRCRHRQLGTILEPVDLSRGSADVAHQAIRWAAGQPPRSGRLPPVATHYLQQCPILEDQISKSRGSSIAYCINIGTILGCAYSVVDTGTFFHRATVRSRPFLFKQILK